MNRNELIEMGFANENELDGFMKRIERDLMDLDDPNELEFVCDCEECQAERSAA